MNVARYIGLFLLRNEQCYIQGLGTLQLIRKAATYDGQSLMGPSHEITIIPGGNVDESLANYIATNEQISITKASNALKDYSTETRNSLQAGGEVRLPFLGKFIETDNKVMFVTDPHLQYKVPSINAQKGASLQYNERPPLPNIPHQPYIPTTPVGSPLAPPPVAAGPPPAMSQGQKHYASDHQSHGREKAELGEDNICDAAIGSNGRGAYYGYERFMTPPKNKAGAPPVLTFPEEDAAMDEMAADSTDTTGMMMTDSAAAMMDTTEIMEQVPVAPPTTTTTKKDTVAAKPIEKLKKTRLVLATTDTKEEAYRRRNEFKGLGYNAYVFEEESNLFQIMLDVKTTHGDGGRIEDSLTKKLNMQVFTYDY